MKKYMLMILTIGFNVCINAQSDVFFSYQYEYREEKDSEWDQLIMLPPSHGLDYNYPADNAPLGAGLLIMTGMSVVYLTRRKDK
ncbi:MAG: hypothetical protein II981_10625 [Bacteroidales bacterium]|nr:hypothetical protein [Bacteroidales bacterium]